MAGFRQIPLALLLSILVVKTAAASSCDSLIAFAPQLPRTSQEGKNKATNDDKCRAFTEQFIRAVTARQAASACEESAVRRRALEYLDVEIEKFNNQIAEQSCGG